MDNHKKSTVSALLYTLGTLFLAVFVIIVAINFAQDARIFQKPLLSASDGNKSSTASTDGYKTIKYSKPQAENTKQTEKKNTTAKPAKPAQSEKPAVQTSVPTAAP